MRPFSDGVACGDIIETHMILLRLISQYIEPIILCSNRVYNTRAFYKLIFYQIVTVNSTYVIKTSNINIPLWWQTDVIDPYS